MGNSSKKASEDFKGDSSEISFRVIDKLRGRDAGQHRKVRICKDEAWHCNAKKENFSRKVLEMIGNLKAKECRVVVFPFPQTKMPYHWLVEVLFEGAESILRLDYNDDGAGIDFCANSTLLSDQRIPIQIRYLAKLSLEFDENLLGSLFNVSEEFMLKNPTFNIYSHNCRYYALYMFDFFLLYNAGSNRISQALDLVMEIHRYSNHVDVPSQMSVKVEREILKLEDLGKEQFIIWRTIYGIN